MKTRHNIPWTIAVQCHDVLGESPVHLPDDSVLARVDIGRTLWYLDVVIRGLRRPKFGETTL